MRGNVAWSGAGYIAACGTVEYMAGWEAVLEAVDVDQPQDDFTGHHTLPSAGEYARAERAAVYRAPGRTTASTLMRRCALVHPIFRAQYASPVGPPSFIRPQQNLN